MLNLICLAACFWALLSSRGWSIISLKAKWSIAIDQQNSCCTGSTPQSTWPAHSLKLQHGFLTNEGKIICQKHFFCLFKSYFLARNMSWKNTICPQKNFRNISYKSHTGVMAANSGCLSVVYWQREIYQRPKIWIGFKKVTVTCSKIFITHLQKWLFSNQSLSHLHWQLYTLICVRY